MSRSDGIKVEGQRKGSLPLASGSAQALGLQLTCLKGMKPWPPRDYLVWVGAPIFQGLLGGQGARAGKGHGRTWAPPAFLKEIGKCMCVPGHGLCGQ